MSLKSKAECIERARQLAGCLPGKGTVFIYLEESLAFGSLTIPVTSLPVPNPTTPSDDFILARLEKDTTRGGVNIGDVRKLSIQLLKARKYEGVTFSSLAKAYNVMIDRLPICIPIAPAAAPAAVPSAENGKKECDHVYVLDSKSPPWFTEPALKEALIMLGDMDLQILTSCVMDYANSVIEALELRALFSNNRIDASDFMARLRHLLLGNYNPVKVRANLVRRALGAGSSGPQSMDLIPMVGFLLLVTRPVEGSSLTKDLDTFANAFETVVTKGSSLLCPWAPAWMAAEDTWIQHWLGDHEHGLMQCRECALSMIVSVQQTLQTSESPWVQTVFQQLDGTGGLQTWAYAVPNSAFFSIQHDLAIRIPTEVEFIDTSNVAPGDPEPFLVDASRLAFGALPVVTNRLFLDALLFVFKAPSEEWFPEMKMARFFNDPLTVKLVQCIDTAMRQWTRPRMLQKCRLGLPVSEKLAELRRLYPSTTLSEDAYDDAKLEASIAWHDEIRAEHEKVVDLLDIEDLFAHPVKNTKGESSLLPPCMRNAVDEARKNGRMDNRERFTVGEWMADMGISGDLAVTITGIAGSVGERDFKDGVNRYMTTRVAESKSGKRAKSLSCQDNINRTKESNCSSACPMRKQVLGETDPGGKLAPESISKIRWQCSKSLIDYQEGSFPKFAISHPIDYVVLQRRALKK